MKEDLIHVTERSKGSVGFRGSLIQLLSLDLCSTPPSPRPLTSGARVPRMATLPPSMDLSAPARTNQNVLVCLLIHVPEGRKLMSSILLWAQHPLWPLSGWSLLGQVPRHLVMAVGAVCLLHTSGDRMSEKGSRAGQMSLQRSCDSSLVWRPPEEPCFVPKL